ncbi:hypothetical protein AB4Y30_05150 [Ornithinibacillus sp. 4-3]|uniref:Uncharacterized protein n=1 Tax=Ornithinibacillus sp. 4-3 TaxID=3231488 RepID=A0AB39HSZ1_9BACI
MTKYDQRHFEMLVNQVNRHEETIKQLIEIIAVTNGRLTELMKTH